MTSLEKLALNRIKNLADEIDSETLHLCVILMERKLDDRKDIHPIATKARELSRWTEAILDQSK